MKKKKIIVFLGLVTTLVLAGCSSKSQTAEETENKAQVETASVGEEEREEREKGEREKVTSVLLNPMPPSDLSGTRRAHAYMQTEQSHK